MITNAVHFPAKLVIATSAFLLHFDNVLLDHFAFNVPYGVQVLLQAHFVGKFVRLYDVPDIDVRVVFAY